MFPYLTQANHRRLRGLCKYYPSPIGAARFTRLMGALVDHSTPQWVETSAFDRCPAMALDLTNQLQRKIFYFPAIYADYYLNGPLARLQRETLEPGDVFLDIGASLGWFSFNAASLVGPTGRVLTFEPDPKSFESISRTVSLNGLNQVQPHNLALADKDGELTFYRDPKGLQSSLVPESAFDEKLEVRVAALDSLIASGEVELERVRMIKIDVEGAEERTLSGMRQLLVDSDRPAIWCEVRGEGASARAPGTLRTVQSLLAEWGYSAHKFEGGARRPLSQADVGLKVSQDILFEAKP